MTIESDLAAAREEIKRLKGKIAQGIEVRSLEDYKIVSYCMESNLRVWGEITPMMQQAQEIERLKAELKEALSYNAWQADSPFSKHWRQSEID